MMQYNDRVRDPRFQRAKVLFATDVAPRWRWGSGHAQANIEYAVCEAALGPADSGYGERAATIIEETIRHHIKPHAQNALIEQCKHVAELAAQTGPDEIRTATGKEA